MVDHTSVGSHTWPEELRFVSCRMHYAYHKVFLDIGCVEGYVAILHLKASHWKIRVAKILITLQLDITISRGTKAAKRKLNILFYCRWHFS